MKEIRYKNHPELSEIEIGDEFSFNGDTLRWRCTDKGTRTLAAIKLDQPDESWYGGPPYEIQECVMDEYDILGIEVVYKPD